MSNEQLRQRAQEIADEHDNDSYSVALAMLEREAKIKAEAVREAVKECEDLSPDDYFVVGMICYSSDLNAYANKLEQGSDNENSTDESEHRCEGHSNCGGGGPNSYTVRLGCGCYVIRHKTIDIEQKTGEPK